MIYIPLPEAHARAEMVKIHVGETPNNLSSTDFEELGNSTPGFSSSDMQRLVTEAEYEPVRELRAATHFQV